jgi:hypothetical protein
MPADSKQARWRAKAAARGKLKRYDRKKPTQFQAGTFVAVDGEGFNTGPERIYQVDGETGNTYKTREHEYALLSASDGSSVYNPTGRLTTKQCLDFLLEIKINDPLAILVCFGAGYDMCHMLAFGLDREEIEILLRGTGDPFARKTLDITLTCHETGERHDYRIELRNRKSLSVWRWPHGVDKYQRYVKKDGTRGWKSTDRVSCVLWDTWGFFQGSFAEAMKQWLPGDPDYDFIVKNKGERAIFDRSEIAEIRRYNDAELRCLVTMMNRVRDAIRDMGLEIKRWDGAGAIAGAMLSAHDIKRHMASSPDDVFYAARHAYSGGHIEAMKMGRYVGTVHHYDINSAYPDQFRNLPSLSNGEWIHGNGESPVPHGFTLVRVEYRFNPGYPFYPLFYRQRNGAIVYPERGHGWYWRPEFEAAQSFVKRFGAVSFEIKEWHHFQAKSDERPFMFIEQAYEQRKRIIEESKRSGIPNGAEKTLKLGYNSVYGKAAQQVGARVTDGELIPPAYFQIEWAGYVTAGCRAKLMTAAIQNPDAVISFATDGIFSTEPLDLDCPAEKVLGAWEYQTHIGMIMVMPGVYWLQDQASDKNPSGLKNYSRGFEKKTMSDTDFILKAWQRGQSSVDVPSRRFITLGSALMSDTFWDMRGCFAETKRSLILNGENSKRYAISVSANKPHKGMVNTHPQDLLEDYDLPLSGLMSDPYPIDWLNAEIMQNAEIAESPRSAADASFYSDMMDARLA